MSDWTRSTIAIVISLPRESARRAHARRLLEALPVPGLLLDAVDGRDLVGSALASGDERLSPRYPFALNQAEIGCFLSHRLAWQALLDSEADQALIFEDDALLGPQFRESLDRLLAQPGAWSYVQLHSHRPPAKGAPFLGCRRLPQVEMVGQVVRRRAARALLAASQRFDRPVDSFLQLTWLTGVPVHHLGQPIVANGGDCFGGSTIARRLSVREKLWRTVRRPLYRTALTVHALTRGGGPKAEPGIVLSQTFDRG